MCSLRGPEGSLLDLEGLNKHWIEGPKIKNHFYVCLQGKIKGEHGVRHHILPCANKTKSGIDVRGTVERLIRLKRSQGLYDGPAVSNIKGKILSTNSFLF